MEFVSKTDIGKRRNNNEDYFLAKNISSDVSLFIVADGLGGYLSGEVASSMLSEYIKEEIEKIKDSLKKYDDDKICSTLRNIISEANTKIYNKEKEDEKYKGMGTTVVCVLVIKGVIYYFSVGDSRLYYIDKDKNSIFQITTDDTYVNELLKNGAITKEEASTHSQKHVLTKAIGVVQDIDITINRLAKNDGYLLLCSDGVTNMLSNDDILDIIKTSKFENVAANIVNEANINGGADNITVVVVNI